MNLLWCALSQLVPILGPIAFLGYQFEIVKTLEQKPDSDYPDVDVNQCVDYFKRGVWPFLAMLCVALPVSMIMSVIVIVAMLIAMAMIAPNARNNPELAAALGVLVYVVMLLVMILLSFLIQIIVLPVSIRAGLSQDFGKAFDVSWIKSFISKMWREILLTSLFMFATSIPIGIAGYAVCCVGLYPAIALISLAYTHFYAQLYKQFLARGGEPVPHKDGPDF